MNDVLPCSTPSQVLDIGLFHPEDAPSLLKLYQNPNSGLPSQGSLNSIEKIIEHFHSPDIYLVLARSSEGEILGYIDLFHINVKAGSLFINMGFVLPNHRAQNIGNQLMNYVINVLAVDLKVEHVSGDILCHHTHMQKLIINFQGKIRGYDIALAVDAYNPQSPGKQARTSALIMGGTFITRPQTLYLPDIYKKDLLNMYDAWHCWHRFLSSDSNLPVETQTTGRLNMITSFHLARIIIYKIGSDFATFFREMEEKIKLNQNITVIQVYLPLTTPFSGGAVDILRSKAYFLGGPIPRWYNPRNDALLMQKMNCEPNFAGIKVFSEHAHMILDIVKKDWEQRQKEK
ncbi:MAG: GNAT family N-acetyltransferase [Eubacteriales bacterium]